MSEFLDWSKIEPPNEIRIKRHPDGGKTIFLDDVELPFHVTEDYEIVDSEGGWPRLRVSLAAYDRVIDETAGESNWVEVDEDEDYELDTRDHDPDSSIL